MKADKSTIYMYTKCLMDPTVDTYNMDAVIGEGADVINERTALSVVQLAIEEFLHWSPTEACKKFNLATVNTMKLKSVIDKIDVPDGIVTDNDYSYIIHKIYPSVYINLTDLTINSYKAMLAKKNKRFFTTKTFSGSEGLQRAAICVHYLIGRCDGFFKSVEDIYDFFAGLGGERFLDKNKLKYAASVYGSTTNLVHHALAKSQRDDFLMHYYQCSELFYKAKRQYAKITTAQGKVNATMETKELNEEEVKN